MLLRTSCPSYRSRERFVCASANCTFVLRDGWGVVFFRVVFDEPAGPPCVLAKVQVYNHLQEPLNRI